MKFSKPEIFDLLKAWILISIAFTILYSDISKNYLWIFMISLLTAGIGFLLHEIAHKIVAQRYGLYAEFKSFDIMLAFAVLLSFFGFIIAAPGAVFIQGNVTKKKNGIISLVGPLTNIILAILFFALFKLEILTTLTKLGFVINSYLAMFNMIPFFMFDGKKVFDWNKVVFSIVFLISIALVFLQYV